MLACTLGFPLGKVFDLFIHSKKQIIVSILLHWKLGYFKLFFFKYFYCFYLYYTFFLLLPSSLSSLQYKTWIYSFKGYFSWFYIFLYRVLVPFRVKFLISGLGNRISILKSWFIVLKLGYAHKIRIGRCGDYSLFFTSYRKKQSIAIRSNNYFNLIHWTNMFRRLKFPDCYNGNGVRLFTEKLTFKYRKRWGVL